MRILITNTGPWGTGSFTVADALVRQFRRLGHEVAFFFPDTGLASEIKSYYYEQPDVYHIWPFPAEIDGFKFPAFPLMIPDPHPRSNWEMTYKDLPEDMLQAFIKESQKRLEKTIEIFKPDVVECQHVWLMNHHLSKVNIPLFCTAHHSDQMGFIYDERIRPYVKESIEKVRKLFAVSYFVKEEVVDLYGIDENRVAVFKNGYDKKVFYSYKKDKKKVLDELGLDISPDKTFVSFAGKISKTKGIDILLQANLLMNRDDIHFLILGGGDYEKFIKTNFPEGIDTSRVHFIGHQSPRMVANVHNICKLSTLPSRSEGFGIACVEAMACGLPLVITREGGLKEIGEGFFVEKENPLELSEAITRIVDLPDDEYSALAQRMQSHAQTFSWETIALERLQYYEEALCDEKSVSL